MKGPKEPAQHGIKLVSNIAIESFRVVDAAGYEWGIDKDGNEYVRLWKMDKKGKLKPVKVRDVN
jgi:hypothetical protein